MYLHIGGDYIINSKKILGIFDMENTTISKYTRSFLANMEKNKQIINTSYELPKSFIVCTDGKVYISQISSKTLEKRTNLKTGGNQ